MNTVLVKVRKLIGYRSDIYRYFKWNTLSHRIVKSEFFQIIFVIYDTTSPYVGWLLNVILLIGNVLCAIRIVCETERLVSMFFITFVKH